MDADSGRGWVVIAHLRRPRGNRGELSASSLSDHSERFQSLDRVWIAGTEYAVERVWYHKDQLVFKFHGINTIEDAERLAGEEVAIAASDRFPLPEGEFYYADLLGCTVVDTRTRNRVGIVTGWQESGGPVLLELDEGRVLIPFAKAILPDIDLEAREIRADLPEGLTDVNA